MRNHFKALNRFIFFGVFGEVVEELGIVNGQSATEVEVDVGKLIEGESIIHNTKVLGMGGITGAGNIKAPVIPKAFIDNERLI